MGNSSNGFRRLVDANAGLTSPAFGQSQRYGAEATGVPDAAELERFGAIKGGDGVLVKTEVIVTQEDLIEDVLGF
ncbi:MAG: hypothetical protein Q9162_004914 [Coniocarpon cinnabarinum]